MEADLAGVRADMDARDTRDAPNMRQADDAVLLDTTAMDADAVFARAMQEVRARLGFGLKI